MFWSTILRPAITTAFTPFVYRSVLACLFVWGFLAGMARWTSNPAVELALLLAIPIGFYCLLAVVTCAGNLMEAGFRKRWAETLGHALMPVIAIMSLLAGIASAEVSTILFVGLRLTIATANYKDMSGPGDDGIEIIAVSPQIALDKVGYAAGFASPGFTNFILMDQSGRFAEFAKAGRARELAGTEAIKSRNYDAWCQNLTIRHQFGPFYSAVLDEVDGCNPF